MKYILPILAVLFMLSCSKPTETAGGSSDSGNPALTASVVTSQGVPSVNAKVRLRTANYSSSIPGLDQLKQRMAIDTFTDNNGRFMIANLELGNYRIEVCDESTSVIFDCAVQSRDTNNLGLDTLHAFATLFGKIDSIENPTYVQIIGLERLIPCDSLGRFTVSNLPQGIFDLRFATVSEDSVESAVVLSKVRLESDDTVFVSANAKNGYSRRIYINTTSTGADISDTIAGFPLLIRLNSSNFDFSQAGESGHDVRLYSADGSLLPFEIDAWDATGKTATIFVRVDTIYGNSFSQYIVMTWGRSDNVQNMSNSSSVFSLVDGFVSVWHMGMTTNDATQNQNNGQEHGTRLAEGIAGKCRKFDGVSSFIDIDSTRSLDMADKNFTLLVWEKSSAAHQTEQIYFEHETWAVAGQYSLSTPVDSVLSFDFSDGSSELRRNCTKVNDGQWHQLAVVIDNQGKSGFMFQDGLEVLRDSLTMSIEAGFGKSWIGCREGKFLFFEGEIDEVWILSRPLSSDWIKLSHENLKINQTVLQF